MFFPLEHIYMMLSGEEFKLHFQQRQSSFSHAYSAEPQTQMQLLYKYVTEA